MRPSVLMATVCGLGRLFWPGMWGSLAGVGWGALVLGTVGRPAGLLSVAATFPLCAWLCTNAEHALGIHDAPPIILDEVWAMSAIMIVLPLSASSLSWLLLAFWVFRFFDVVKPPPLKHMAKLPAGWGIMADDLGAALYTIAFLIICQQLLH